VSVFLTHLLSNLNTEIKLSYKTITYRLGKNIAKVFACEILNFRDIMNKLNLLVVLFILSLSSANATIISANGVGINALDLNGVASSFEEFYDMGGSSPFSSNTGFELSNQIVFFVATLNSELAIFTTISGQGGLDGTLQASVTGTDGNISFLDDPTEAVTGNTINWQYIANRSDGLIYSNFISDTWSVNFDFLQSSNVFGYNVLSFDANGNDSVALNLQGIPSNLAITSESTAPPAPVSAPAPATLALLGFGLLFISSMRRR
jgi:hypothetical protein